MKNLTYRAYNIIRNLLAIIGLSSLIAGGAGFFLFLKSYNLPPRLFVMKVLKKAGLAETPLAGLVKQNPVKFSGLKLPDLNNINWKGHGANNKKVLTPIVYNQENRPISIVSGSTIENDKSCIDTNRKLPVRTTSELLTAIRQAKAGDMITLRPGVYTIKAYNIEITRSGTPDRPILVRAEKYGDVTIELNSFEGFWLGAAYWIFENLDIKGISKDDNHCEHAFHVVGGAKGFVLRNCRIHEFNAMIKANGLPNKDGTYSFPDYALIEGNTFYNSRIRNTSHPVTFIDVVGSNNWTIRGNLIADFAKGQGDRISYAAFLKGNGKGGIFENNLVIGEYNTIGGVRVGLSLGGGGSGAQFCREGDNSIEHTGGIVRNNIVMYCSDVGLYLNKAKNTTVFNNTFYKTMGIDVRFPSSNSIIQNNLLTGKIRERDGGTSRNRNNLLGNIDSFSKWFQNPEIGDFRLKRGDKIVDKGITSDEVSEDFCGNVRDKNPDIGAIEYDQTSSDCCLPILGE